MKKQTGIILTMIMIFILSACSGKTSSEPGAEEDLDNVNKEGMPVVEEPITLDIFAGRAPLTASDWGDVPMWQEYAEQSNVNVDWRMIPHESLEEQKNLKLSSDDLPDAFYAAWVNRDDLRKYSEQGLFIELSDLIEEYAPNLQKIFDEYPEVEQAITLPDGNIYSFPTIQEFESMRYSTKPFINKEFLDVLDMDVPETTDDFYEYLKAVKENDVMGDGEDNAVPYGAESIDQLINWIRGSFGIGQSKQSGSIDLDPETDELRFYPTSDDYKEMLEYVHKLYDEELIEQNIFSIENDQFLANGSAGVYGSTNWHSPKMTFGEDAGEPYIGMPALEGPNGDQIFSSLNHLAVDTSSFVITSANENPAATVRWIDHFYGEEGAELLFMGIEGETFEKTDDGELEYVEEITNNQDGLTFDQAVAEYMTWPGGGFVGSVKEKYFKGGEASEQELEATEKLKPYEVDEVWPEFFYTSEESRKMDSFGSDIDKYVGEMRDKFIAGEESFDDWDKYVETIESMKLDEYMDVEKDAYDRYRNN